MARIDAFLQMGREHGCSDLHFTVGLPPVGRLDGEMTPFKYRELTAEETSSFLREIMDEAALAELAARGATDFSYEAEGQGRFRLNVYQHRRGMAAICRIIASSAPRLSDLGLPPVVSEFTRIPSGLVLVTGGPGTGKTTTLAAMIDDINENQNVTIVTLEDPVEILHECKKAQVVQREVGRQVVSFQDGLRSALRQDPDVILIGEMRDAETISAAIEASETGHLVFGTLHTRGAYQTLHRLVDAFPSESQSQIRHTLADNLKAVVSQELVRHADGRGRRVVPEILVMTPAIAQMIREGKTHQIPSALSTGRRLGMQLLDQALLRLVESGDVDPNEAFLKAVDKREFIFHVTQPELLALAETGPTSPALREAA
jgi:twitching motility protein PilT